VSAGTSARTPKVLVVFVLALFIALIREQNIVVLLALLAGWIVWRVRPLAPPARAWAGVRAAAPVLGAIAVVGCFQLLYDHWAAGSWSLPSYGREHFTPGAFNEARVLFSYNHGLFVWYPVLGVMLAVGLWQRRARSWGLLALAIVAALTVLYGSWSSWFLGGGFGLRGFVDIVPVVTVAGAVAIAALGRRPRIAALCALVVASLVTMELMAGYWDGSIPFAHTTAHIFWQHVVGGHSLLSGRL
jgi:hypothetical protein